MEKGGPGFIPAHGGYKALLSYQKCVIVYDATIYFTKRFFPAYGDRTVDQMVQAARSGKQNIVEGSMASGTSKKTELFLTGVARASLEELAEDYGDFLRTRGLKEWPASHPYAQRMRELNRTSSCSYEAFRKGIEHEDPEISANVILGLTRVTCYLLDQQIRHLEQAFLKEGGLSELMTQARLKSRRAGRRD